MARARRGGLRRVLRVLLRTLAWTTAALVVVIVAAVSVVLWTPWGTRTALHFALERYDAAIPGSVELQRVGGTIGGTLTLDGLVLRDAAEHPLVAIGHVETRLRLGALVGRVVAFDHFDATAVELHVGGGQAEFLDLAPPREEPPPPTPGLVGPDLPIGFDGPVGVDGFTLWQHAETGDVAPLLHGAVVHAYLRSQGREALLRIDALSGVVDVARLTVANAHGRVTWSDPRVQLDDFGALTDRGFVEHARLAVDLDREAGDAALATVIDPIALALQLGIEAAPPLLQPLPLRVTAGGTLTQTWAAIDLAQDDRVAARLLVGGALQPELQLAAVGHAGARLPPPTPGRTPTGCHSCSPPPRITTPRVGTRARWHAASTAAPRRVPVSSWMPIRSAIATRSRRTPSSPTPRSTPSSRALACTPASTHGSMCRRRVACWPRCRTGWSCPRSMAAPAPTWRAAGPATRCRVSSTPPSKTSRWRRCASAVPTPAPV
ncbi:MAG: hypothetical protein IPN32_15840 [Deltaproteobacteria bacterium]|nr:hypothetical protein [Deltaproteobacteria bacterium]